MNEEEVSCESSRIGDLFWICMVGCIDDVCYMDGRKYEVHQRRVFRNMDKFRIRCDCMGVLRMENVSRIDNWQIRETVFSSFTIIVTNHNEHGFRIPSVNSLQSFHIHNPIF